MRGWIGALAALVIAGPTSADSGNKDLAPGNAPSPVTESEKALSVAEQAVRDQLLDPDSAHFKGEAAKVVDWIKKGALGRRIDGPIQIVCGQVNAKNRMGGYNGFGWFEVDIKDGQIIGSDLDDPTNDVPGVAYYGCKNVGLAD